MDVTSTDTFSEIIKKMKLGEEIKGAVAEMLLLNPQLLTSRHKVSESLSSEAEQCLNEGKFLLAENRLLTAAKLAFYLGQLDLAKLHLERLMKIKQTSDPVCQLILANFEQVCECVKQFYTAEASTRYKLHNGLAYLALEMNASRSFEIFADLVNHGYVGFVITRASPDLIRRTYELGTTRIRWLAKVEKEGAVSPSDLLGMSLIMVQFMRNTQRSVVLLHGIEYLVTINGFKPVLQLIQRLNEANAENQGILIMPLVPGSLDDRAHALLIAECAIMPPQVSESNPNEGRGEPRKRANQALDTGRRFIQNYLGRGVSW